MEEKKKKIPYTHEEDKAIVSYVEKFSSQPGHRGSIKGCQIWKDMVVQKITQRSWQSMKDRYLKYLINDTKSIEEDTSDQGDNSTLSCNNSYKNFSIKHKDENRSLSDAGNCARNSKLAYDSDDDRSILDYVFMLGKEYGEYGSTRGNLIWKEMERIKVTKHSWQSMKDRYLKHLQDEDYVPQSNTFSYLMHNGRKIIYLNNELSNSCDNQNKDNESEKFVTNLDKVEKSRCNSVCRKQKRLYTEKRYSPDNLKVPCKVINEKLSSSDICKLLSLQDSNQDPSVSHLTEKIDKCSISTDNTSQVLKYGL